MAFEEAAGHTPPTDPPKSEGALHKGGACPQSVGQVCGAPPPPSPEGPLMGPHLRGPTPGPWHTAEAGASEEGPGGMTSRGPL